MITVKEYNSLCSEDGCFMKVKELDIERSANGEIYERSKKCHKCRTDSDRKAIKGWRRKQRKRLLNSNDYE